MNFHKELKREGKDRLKDGTEQAICSLPEDVPRDYGGAGMESAAVPPHAPLATLPPSLAFAAGFGVKSGQGQPRPLIPEAAASASAACNGENFLVKLPFFLLPPFFPFPPSFFFAPISDQQLLFRSAMHPSLSL